MNKLLLVVIIIILIIVGVGIFMLFNGGSKNILNNSSSNTTIQGMKVQTLTPGAGASAKAGDSVTVNYTGTLSGGTVFDSSYKRNAPFTFVVGKGMVIKGWDLGVVGMKVGEKRKLTIPPELAYGTNGVGNIIPPNSTLTFQIEMVSINNK